MSSRVRQLRQFLALQEEIARRLNRPIDLDQAALDGDEQARSFAEQDQNSLIPVGPDMIQELMGFMDSPSIVDAAMQNAQNQQMAQRLKAAREQGIPMSGPMIRSVTQLDR